MKVLVCEVFVSLTAKTVAKYFKKLGFETIFKTYYTPTDLDGDFRIDKMIEKDVDTYHPDLLFSINFWPPISRVAHKKRTVYISYSYDTPQVVPREYIFDTNYIFLFDGAEVSDYIKKGFERIYHAPLCTDIELWDSQMSRGDYRYDVSLIGSLYKSHLYSLIPALDEYYQGYLKALIAAQQKIYGYYIIEELLTPAHMENINSILQKTDSTLTMTPPQLSWAIGSYINYLDRVTLLRLLQKADKETKVSLFSDKLDKDDISILSGVDIRGRVDYEKEMPLIFKESKINLNPTSRVIRSGIPQRVLDVLGCGSFVLSSYQPEIMDFFIPNEEIVVYESYEDALEKARFYLKNDLLREEIARRGYEKIKLAFTYEERLLQLLEIAGF